MDVFLEIYAMYSLGNYSTYFEKKKFSLGVDCQGEPIGDEATGEFAKDCRIKNKVNHTYNSSIKTIPECRILLFLGLQISKFSRGRMPPDALNVINQ